MTSILTIAAACASAVSLIGGISYALSRVKTLRAYKDFMEASDLAVQELRADYWRLDKTSKRIALFSLALYALTFICLIPNMPLTENALGMAALIGTTISILTIGLTATICNTKETELRFGADMNRRARRERDAIINPERVGKQFLSKPVSPRDAITGGAFKGLGCSAEEARRLMNGQVAPTTEARTIQKDAAICPDDVTVKAAPAAEETDASAQSLIIVGDFGKDMDDEDTLVLSDGVKRAHVVGTHGSRKQELFEMLAVVANLAPAMKRARLAKGTLKLLGHPNVPVGVGTDCGLTAAGHDHEFAGINYLAGEDEVEPGADLLVRSLNSCADGSAIMLLISGLTDMANLLREHGDLVKAKVSIGAIMGGVEQKDNQVLLDAEGYMIPDSAANNKFDMDAAKYVYRRFQELGIPLVILTREAAYAAPVPRDLYDRMAATGHPVGVKLRKVQKDAIQDLWVRANMAADDPKRNKLPERCNREWFCNTFCAGNGKDRDGANEIWDLIVCFQLYDPMTLIAAVPELAERFFEPVIVKVNGVDHKVIGVSKAVNGVKNVDGLVTFMIDSFITSLTASAPAQSQE